MKTARFRDYLKSTIFRLLWTGLIVSGFTYDQEWARNVVSWYIWIVFALMVFVMFAWVIYKALNENEYRKSLMNMHFSNPKWMIFMLTYSLGLSLYLAAYAEFLLATVYFASAFILYVFRYISREDALEYEKEEEKKKSDG